MTEQEKLYKSYKQQNKHQWWPELDVLRLKHLAETFKIAKQIEKEIYKKIKKEIKSKKYDDVCEMKALRFSNDQKKFQSKYIDLRFKDLWDEKEYEVLIPLRNKLWVSFRKYHETNIEKWKKLEHERIAKAEKDRGW